MIEILIYRKNYYNATVIYFKLYFYFNFSRLFTANCDSAPEADAKAAIDMAFRAVNELG
jgi:hypothetical protein